MGVCEGIGVLTVSQAHSNQLLSVEIETLVHLEPGM